ncbi:MAG: rod-binding protein [Neomegalonema sp.]|nr:rod-binding protein [Neomegalonema sp.]
MNIDTSLQTSLSTTPLRQPRIDPQAQDAQLRKVATDFEAAFVSEMLKYAGVAENNSAFNGGPGEDAFRSFLLREYAEEISGQGVMGLADKIYTELKEKVSPDAE